MKMPNLDILPIEGKAPRFTTAAPTDLYIEPDYQRDLSENSIKLIRKLAHAWNWSHMKPPIVVKDGQKLLVVDGQHTAIAACSRGDIAELPVVVIDAIDIEKRAVAFVAHNTLRVEVTPQQIYFSKLAAGDETARLVQTACERSGAKVLRFPPAHGIYKTGETMAVRMLQSIVEKKGAPGLTRLLKILVRANRQVKNTELAALFQIIYSKKFDAVSDEDLVSIVGGKTIRDWEHSVAKLRERMKISLSAALAEKWVRASKGLRDE